MTEGYTVFLPEVKKAFPNVTLKEFDMHWSISVDGLEGWMRSWSPFLAYTEAVGTRKSEAMVAQFVAEMKEALGVARTSDPLVLVLPLQVLLARKED